MGEAFPAITVNPEFPEVGGGVPIERMRKQLLENFTAFPRAPQLVRGRTRI